MNTVERYDVVLVGGGPATRLLNKSLHQLRPGLTTVVIRDEDRIVNHCGTPYIVEQTIPWERGLIPETLVTRFGTEILVDPLVGGDPDAHEITLRSGRRLRYGQLVLATGTDQTLPPIAGTDLDRVLKVRRTEDVQDTMARLGDIGHVTVIGGGYIGLEFAVALRRLGHEVALVEILPHVMGGRIDPDLAAKLEARLTALGIDLRLDTAATRITGEGQVAGVELDDGTSLATDAVLSAVGVAPSLDFADALGLARSVHGLQVDDLFRTNLPDVYAVGDCIETRCLVTGEPVPGKLGSNAGQMARTLALHLAGVESRPFPGVINAAVTVVDDLAYGGVGLSEQDAARLGLETLVGRITSTSQYDNMPHHEPVDARIVYRASDQVVLGGELLGRFNPAGFIEALGHLIERRATLTDVVTSSYSSHPELTPKTNKPFWVAASEPLLYQHHRQPQEVTS
jgi:NADH dehydrogenase